MQLDHFGLSDPAGLAIGAAVVLVLVGIIWFATRKLPAIARILAVGLVVLGVAVLLAMPQVGLLDGMSRLGQKSEVEREAKVRADEARERAKARRQINERKKARRDREALETRRTRSAEPSRSGEPKSRGLAPTEPAPTEDTTTRSAAGTSDPDWDVQPVYYGTDRNREAEKDNRIAYGADRAKRLEVGRALVTIPQIHEKPQIERPWVYTLPFTQVVIYEEPEDPKRHFTLRSVQAMTESRFMALVRARLAKSEIYKDHALVFVHGFNSSFDFALYRAAQIAYDLKFDGAPFVYSWPSQGQVLSYSYDRESAGQAEPYLRQFLDLVVKASGAKKISVIAHSMGNQVLLPVLRGFKQDMPEGVGLSQVILAAPDVDRDTFEFLASEIQGVSQGMTLYAHANDRALDVSKQFWGGVPRAGDVPEGGPVIVAGMDTIDVTATSTEIFDLHHSGYAENKALLNDIELLIQTGERPPEKRIPILQRVTTDKGDYWKYPAAE